MAPEGQREESDGSARKKQEGGRAVRERELLKSPCGKHVKNQKERAVGWITARRNERGWSAVGGLGGEGEEEK